MNRLLAKTTYRFGSGRSRLLEGGTAGPSRPMCYFRVLLEFDARPCALELRFGLLGRFLVDVLEH